MLHLIKTQSFQNTLISVQNLSLWVHPTALLSIPFVGRLEAEQGNCRITAETGGKLLQGFPREAGSWPVLG